MNHRNADRDAAIAAGRNKYIGRPCRQGHNGLRYARNHTCVDCLNDENDRKAARRARG